jgi:hypothetical protein
MDLFHINYWCLKNFSLCKNRISGIMVSLLTSSVVDREFEHRSGKTKDYKIGICCFSAKHTALRRKSKDWFARNQNNVSRVKLHVYPRTVVSVSYIVACWSSSKRSSSSSHWKLTRHDIAEKLLNWHKIPITHSLRLCIVYIKGLSPICKKYEFSISLLVD